MGIPALPGVAAFSPPPAAEIGVGANAVVSGTFAGVGPGKAFPAYGPMNLVVWASLATSLATTIGSTSATLGSATGAVIGQSINSVNAPPGTTIGGLSGTTATMAFATQTWTGLVDNGVAEIRGMTLPVNLATLVGAAVRGPGIQPLTTVAGVGAVPGTLLLSLPATATSQNSTPVPYEFDPTGNCIAVTGTDLLATITGAALQFNSAFNIERAFDGGRTWIVCNVGDGGQIAQYTANTPLSLSFGEPEKNVLYRINVVSFTAVSNVTMNYRISATGQASTTLSVQTL